MRPAPERHYRNTSLRRSSPGTGPWQGIEATVFRHLPDDVWEQLAAEARSLTAFLADREPEVYRRYDHWWSKLPSAEARLLPGD